MIFIHNFNKSLIAQKYWIICNFILIIKFILFDILIGQNPFRAPITKSIFISIPCTIIIFQAGAFLFKNGWRLYYSLLLNLLFSLLFLSDILNVRYFGEPLSFWSFQLVGNLPWTFKSILALIKSTDLLMFADLPILLLFIIKNYKTKFLPNIRIFFICFLFGTIGFAIKPIKQYFKYHVILQPFYFLSDLIIYTPVGYHLFETIQGYYGHTFHRLSTDEKQKIKNWFKLKQSFLTSDTSYVQFKNVGKGKNLICIQIESLGGFAINHLYQNKEVTPNINKILEHSIYFVNYYYQNNGGGSSDAEFITLNSMYPVSKGATFSRFPENVCYSLPLLLGYKNYETIAIHDNSSVFWNRGHAYPSLGINRFFDDAAITHKGRIPHISRDENLFIVAASILKEESKPFFALLITIDSHLAGAWLTKGINDYFSAMFKIDSYIGQFIDNLKSRGQLDSSIIVLYGDHGPPLDFERIIRNEPELSWIHEKNTIPFIIYSPLFSFVSIDKKAGQIDALPTLAYIMGIDTTEFITSAMGRNIFTTKESFVNVHGTCLVDNDKNDNAFFRWIADGPIIADLIITSNYFKQTQ